MWPVFMSTHRKLYEKMEELKKTASFIDVAGVTV